jgi:tripartite-type tricarboxylate transporter receptor subunit TctC
MQLDRRSVLLGSLGALPLLAGTHGAVSAGNIESLTLVEPLGKPSVVWTLFNSLVPALHRAAGTGVTHETISGDDGLAALRYMMAGASGRIRLWGGPLMATELAEATRPDAIRLDSLTPIAKLTNGFSMALFCRAGSDAPTWSALLERSAQAPLALSSLQVATAAHVARLLLQKQAGLRFAATQRDRLPDVMADVIEGRAELGILPTVLVTKSLDRLQPLVTFGAARNPVLTATPTFAELTGNPKLAFTESVAVFGPPTLRGGLQAELTKLFAEAGQSEEIIAASELSDYPVTVNGPDVVLATMERNRRLVARLLG